KSPAPPSPSPLWGGWLSLQAKPGGGGLGHPGPSSTCSSLPTRRLRRHPPHEGEGEIPAPSFLLQPPLDPLDRSASRLALSLQPRQSLGDQPLLVHTLLQRRDPRRRPSGPHQAANGLHQQRRDQGDGHPLPIHHPHTFLPPLHGEGG